MLTRMQVASVLGVSLSTVDRLIRTGTLKSIHIRKSVRVDPGELKAFMKRGTQQSACGTARRTGRDQVYPSHVKLSLQR
jgi:excisionase family DNA binding protein